MANRRFIDFPIASTSGDTDIILIWQDGANKQTTKATFLGGLPENLEDLNDVVISGLTNGQILRYDSVTGKWENTDQGNLNLNDLNDVSIVSPSNGQVLVYNSSTSQWENSSGGYVPYVGAVTTVDLGAQGLRAGYVRFDTTVAGVPNEQGLMFWDADDETVDIVLNGYTMKIGEDLFYPVKNQTGSTIAKGVAVRFNGTVGNSGRLLIAPFIADGSVASSRFMGVTAEEILNGEDGKVLYFGRVRAINTNAFNEGDILYASTTVAGGYQTAIPLPPNNIVQVAAVVTKSATVGTIFVRPTLGSNINTDEGVKITSVADKNLLQYQSGTSLWENKSLAQVLGGTSAQFVKGDGSLDSTTYGTGTVTSVGLSSATSGVTIGSSPVTTSGTITLAISTASGSQNGLLSSTDWTTFNGKQNALTNPVTGTGTTNYLPKFTGASTIGNSNLSDDGSNLIIDSRNFNFGNTGFGVYLSRSGLGPRASLTTRSNINWVDIANSSDWSGVTLSASGGNVLIGTTADNGSGARLQNSGALTTNTTTVTNGTRSWIISPSGASIIQEFGGVVEGRIDPSSGGNSWLGATSGTTGAGAKHYFSSTGAATFASSITATTAIITQNGSSFGTNSASGTGLKIQAGNGASTLQLNGRDNSGIDDNFVAFRKFDGTTLQAAFYVRSNIFSIRDATNTDVLNIVGGNVGIGTTGGINVVSGWTNLTVNGSTTGIIGVKANEVDYGAMYANTPNNNFVIQAYGASNNGNMIFLTASTERFSITGTDGYVRLSTNSGGIQFNGDTSSANALDDYEEGSFSPTIFGSSTAGTVTYGARNGLYTKIGRAVSFNIYVDWSAGTGTGNLRLSGLPFTASATGVYPAVAIGEISNIALSANTIATARVQISTNEIWFGQAVVGGGGNSSVAYDGAGYMVLSGTYYV